MTDQDQAGSKAPNAIGILVVVCVALFFGVVNTSAVAVVLPDISTDLSVDSGQVSWLMTGFMLVYGIAIPFYGRLADIYGARPLFLLGVGIFCFGSLLSALAPNYELLLTARIVQAAGGAAVPGLGMTLASRAFGPEARGTVLGVIAATIGVGGGIGPLLGGALSESLGWESVFYISAAAAIAIPVGLRILPREEDRTKEKLDILGGGALALMVSGVLLVPSEGARSGWSSPLVFTGIAVAAAGLVLLSARQLTVGSPFIPKEFLRSSRYVALVGMSFTVMAAYIAPIIALPVLLTVFHDLSALEVGLVMVPGAILTSLFGVIAGRVTDRRGARLPTWIGAPLMLLAVLGLSSSTGSSVWIIAAFTGVLGAGFGLMNTPLPAAISRIVRGPMLASALSINSMLFFIGGGLGTAVVMAVATSRGGPGESALNPLHSGAAAGFSDAFLLLAVPVAAAVALSLKLPGTVSQGAAEGAEPAEPEIAINRNWVPSCSVPWMPQCEEHAAASTAVREEQLQTSHS